MTAREFQGWLDFFNRHGRCGPVRMYDLSGAIAARGFTGGDLAKHLPYDPSKAVKKAAKGKDGLKGLIGAFGGVKIGRSR